MQCFKAAEKQRMGHLGFEAFGRIIHPQIMSFLMVKGVGEGVGVHQVVIAQEQSQ